MLATLFFGRRRWRQAQLPALAQLRRRPPRRARRRLRRHRPAMISLALLVLLALLCLIEGRRCRRGATTPATC